MLCQDKSRPVSFLMVLSQVVTAVVESGKNMSAEQKKTERCPLLYEWHKKQYIGAAHGMAGIYYMLMQVREAKLWGLLSFASLLNVFLMLGLRWLMESWQQKMFYGIKSVF